MWMLYDDNEVNNDQIFSAVAVGTKYRKNKRIIIGTDIAVVVDMISICGLG